MGYKNLTISGKKDGFGCQFNAKLSGLAFCLTSRDQRWGTRYDYIHTPFASVSHGWRDPEDVARLNEFVGIPDNRHGKKIHVKMRYLKKTFNDPNAFYNSFSLQKIREYYWSTSKPERASHDIVVHIRRGDVQPDRGGDRASRHLPNWWYNRVIPEVASKYPSHYSIAIYSEGEVSEFETILNDWPQDLVDRTEFRLSQDDIVHQQLDLLTAYHHMVTAKVLLMSKSGLAYTAGILNENDVLFVRSGARGQRIPLNHWTRNSWGG
jgi:hypothetical protein